MTKHHCIETWDQEPKDNCSPEAYNECVGGYFYAHFWGTNGRGS